MSAVDSKFTEARRHILGKLQSGDYQPGSKFISENKLTEELGFGKGTIREAVSSLVAEGIFTRVKGSGTYIKNLPETENTVVAVKQTDLIVGNPLHQGETDHFIGALLAGLHRELDALDWTIRLAPVDDVNQLEDSIKTLIKRGRLADTVFLGGFTVTRKISDYLTKQGKRLICIGRPEDATLDYVHNDHIDGMRTVLDYLLTRGHKRIALIDRQISHVASFEERYETYLTTLTNHNIIPDARLIVTHTGFDLAAGESAAAQLLARNTSFTAAIVSGDWIALGFRRHLEQVGWSVPGDISLICYGSVLKGVDSLSMRHSELARLATKYLVMPYTLTTESRLVHPELIKGETVKYVN